MFPASIKSEAAFASSYKRGQQIARSGKVRGYSTDYFDDGKSCSVSGTVAGSAGETYKTWVTLDLSAQKVLDYDCTCPAQSNYAGMCKHSIGMALAYLNDTPLAAAGAGGATSSQAGGSRGAAAVGSAVADAVDAARKARAGAKATKTKKKPAPKTSQALLSLMNVQAALVQNDAKRANEALVERPKDPVELVCTIARNDDPYGYRYYGGEDDMYELRLRVKRGKASYVVKRVDELVADWEAERYRQYGKNLGFTHSKRVFDERSNRVLEFVATMERAQRALYQSRSQYWYAGSGTGVKALPLTSHDTIALLDILQGGEVTFETKPASGTKTTKTYAVTSSAPQLDIRLQESDDGSWLLSLPREAECIRCDKEMYIVAGTQAGRCDEDFVRRAGTVLEGLLPGGASPLVVAAEDVPVFCERVLPALEAAGNFEVPDALAEMAPPEAEFSFRIGALDGCVTCSATVSYDEDVVGLFDELAKGQPVRDIARELAAQALVRSYFPNGYVSSPDYGAEARKSQPSYYSSTTYGRGTAPRPAQGLGAGPGMPWFPSDEVELLYELLSDGLDEFAAMGQVYLSENLRGVQVHQAPEIRVEASVSSGLLDLAVDASGMTPEDLMAYLASYRRKQRFVRLSNGDIVKLGEGARALGELADGLGISDEALLGTDGRGGQVAANRTLFVDALMKDASGVRFDRDESFRSIVRAFDTVADSDFVEPDSLRDVLRGYQRTGFKWLSTLSTLGFGGILADDMGLGKTIQVISLLLARKEGTELDAMGSAAGGAESSEHLPSLVVCPASLVYNWLAEIERFAPELDAVGVLGNAPARRAIVAKAAEHDVLVSSYDLMKRDIEAYENAGFDIVVLDEAHYIKNHATLSAKAAKRLPARVRFALTGTPIENRLSELWSIFDFLMPGILGSAESFAKRFSKPIEAGEEGASGRLQKLVSPFILRRLKSAVLTDLPDKNESIVYAAMSGEQDKLYKANADKLALMLSKQMPEEFARNKIAVLAELTRLRQLCCDPHLVYDNYKGGSAKLDACMELIASAVEGGHKALLFSQFTSMLDILCERMQAAKVGYLLLTGATSKEQRVRLVREFQEGPVPVFLISLKAGGVGLNLTAADIVIHFDPWWNLAAQNQATDRAHRIGQTRDVSVFKLIAKGTIEEKIVQMQESKRDLAESVIGGDGVSSSALTREDVLALIGAASE